MFTTIISSDETKLADVLVAKIIIFQVGVVDNISLSHDEVKGNLS